MPSRSTRRAASAAIVINNTTGTIVIHLATPQADFSNVLASEFAAPVPASAPAADTSLNPLPATGPYVIKSYPPKSADRRGEEPVLPGLALPRRRARRQSRPCHLGHRPQCLARAPPRDDRQGRLDELLPVPSKRLAGMEQKFPKRLRRLHAGEPPLLLHEHAGRAVRPARGAARRELRDLAPVARGPRGRAGERKSHGERPAAGLSVLPAAPSLPPRSAHGAQPRARVGRARQARHRLEPRRDRRPAVHRIPRLRPPQRSASTPARTS